MEYVALKEAAIRRDIYLRANPALLEIDGIIARRSECQKTVQELAIQVAPKWPYNIYIPWQSFSPISNTVYSLYH